MWILPRSMTTQLDFRNGDIVPNTWFPHCARVDLLGKLSEIDDGDLRVILRRWCEQQCQGDVFVPYGTVTITLIAFQLDTDIMNFCLTWQDIVVEQWSL